MTVSQLVEALQVLQVKHGDVPVHLLVSENIQQFNVYNPEDPHYEPIEKAITIQGEAE